jgi:hypothetical protein
MLAIQLPHIACDATCDLSGIMGYDYCAKNHYQVGVDLLHIVGPYGFLQFPGVYSGWVVNQKLVFGILFGVIFSCAVLRALRFFPSRSVRLVWLLAVMPTAIPAHPDAGADALYYLFFLLAAHHLIMRDRYPSSFVWDAVVLCLATLLALAKSTNLVLVGLILAAVLVGHALRKRFLGAARDCGCVAAAFVVFWILADQKLAHIPNYFANAIGISGGYSEAAALSPPGTDYLVGLAMCVWGVFVVGNSLRIRNRGKFAGRLALTAFEFGMLFLVWKHGYVRADQHLMHFWTLVPAAGMLFFLAHEESPRRGAPSGGKALVAVRNWFDRFWRAPLLASVGAAAFSLFTICALLSHSMATALQPPKTVVTLAELKAQRIAEDIFWLFNWRGRIEKLDAWLQQNRKAAALPAIKQAVGNATIDQYGWLPGLVLLNGLAYHPRPMPLTINTCTEPLMRANAEFFRDEARAPEYVIGSISALDGCLAPQEDSLALLEILRHYRPILVERGLLLLKRVPIAALGPPRPLGEPCEYHWGDRIELPESGDRYLWAKVDIKYSMAGRLRGFLYKPRPIAIAFESRGYQMGSLRFLACAGTAGFLIRPFLVTTGDLLAAYDARVITSVQTTAQPDCVRFQIQPEDYGQFIDKISISWFTIENPTH